MFSYLSPCYSSILAGNLIKCLSCNKSNICVTSIFTVPIAEYFTIHMHYGLGDVENWNDMKFRGYVDFCYADFISRLELIQMANEMKLHVEGCSFWWRETKNE